MELVLPDRLNAESVLRTATELTEAVRDPSTEVLVLRGSDGVFCRGLDLGGAKPSLRSFAELLLMVRCTVPTIALVDGEALGGGLGLMAACDVVVCTPRARFGLPEALFGMVPGMVMPLIRERISPAAARLLALRGLTIPASEAHSLGLVDEIDTNLEKALSRQARMLARPDPLSVRWIKEVPFALRAAVLAGAEATTARLADPTVAARVRAFEQGEVPWGAP